MPSISMGTEFTGIACAEEAAMCIAAATSGRIKFRFTTACEVNKKNQRHYHARFGFEQSCCMFADYLNLLHPNVLAKVNEVERAQALW